MRVLFLIDILTRGGSEKRVSLLADRLRDYGHETGVLTINADGDWADYLRERDILVIEHRWPLWFPGVLQAAKHVIKLARAIRSFRPDVVFCIKYHVSIWGCLAAWVAGVPLRIAYRVSMAYEAPESRLPDVLAEPSIALTNCFIANSEAVRASIQRVEGIDAERIGIIYQGVDRLDLTAEMGAAFRAEYGIAPDAPLIGMLANFYPVKNHIMLVEAARTVVDAHPRAVFVLAGGNDRAGCQEGVEAAIEECGLQKSFILTGRLPDPHPLLSSLDIGVLCSEAEGFPNAIQEYMIAGKPVVATAVGGCPEAVADGETGILVPSGDRAALADALVTLLANSDLREQYGAAGQARMAEHFTWAQELNAWDRLFREGCS